MWPLLSILLRPLAWLYGGVMAVRNYCFDRGLLHSRSFPVPTVAVGNLAVGGTGKTPHAEYLLRLLAPLGQVALLSRGYGRKTRDYVRAGEGATADDVGDEPLQVYRKLPQVAVAVCADRCAGMERLLASEPALRAVVLDDAFQHRYLRAGLYLLLTDYHRLYVDDYVLPAGRLREGRKGARRADAIIVTKCPDHFLAEENAAEAAQMMAEVRQRLAPRSAQRVYFTTFTYSRPYGLFNAAPATDYQGRDALVLTGIAHPETFHRHLAACGLRVHALRFADHHAYRADEAAKINAAFAALPEGSVVFTTEKDAARLPACAHLLSTAVKQALLVQPVEVTFLNHEEESFNQQITDYVTSHTANC